MGTSYQLEIIQPHHNRELKKVIQTVLKEFGAVGEGYAGADPEMEDLFTAYQHKGASYWVILKNGKLLGGGGVGPLKEESSEWCEVQKMYFLPEARGAGLGKDLLKRCLDFATKHYRYCYIETLHHMYTAQALYKKFGFSTLSKPKGNTGHSGCDVWLWKALR